jgi:hypothetical protein
MELSRLSLINFTAKLQIVNNLDYIMFELKFLIYVYVAQDF